MKKILLVGVVLSLQACVYDHTGNIEELGSNYYYMGDGRESQILLSRNDKRSGGQTIVPEEVTHYGFNEEYIIARNIQDRINKEIKFWIIDKRQGTQPVPLDSTEFYEELQKLNLDLKLQPRK
ncbi:DUF3997 domain-containing protein [Pontibacter sp. Tf4]|uniref:DUF3997 domain-containing protein n=1 Tax=Pontibacter sp. Tf4 TaxID=2761620 RepID=UPI0016295F46|nr:DUF3997 domain-containing protein [Pontibacter sp. Tf4]MBB6613166.1 DUF3997 domain-containing protein [Pontibacter sp. Tf4]